MPYIVKRGQLISEPLGKKEALTLTEDKPPLHLYHNLSRLELHR
jgi:hypothetical protein